MDRMIHSPKYEMVFILEAVIPFQTRKISSSLWKPFCLRWPGKSRPSHEILWSAELAPEKLLQPMRENLADPMIQAIMTSRRKKRANAQNFRKWRRRLWLKQLF